MSQSGRLGKGGSGGGGDVVGPGGSTAGDIAVFADNTGKLLADSGVNIADINVITLLSANVDLTMAAVTTLFTVPAGHSFVPTLVGWWGTNLNTVTVDAVFNIGDNPAGYDDIVNGGAFFLTVTNTTISQPVATGAPVMAPGTAVKINVVVPMTATTGLGRFYLQGVLI